MTWVESALNNPLLGIFPGKIMLNDSGAIRCLIIIQVQNLATEGMYKILISAQMLQPKLLAPDPCKRFLKNGCRVLLTVRCYRQVFTRLLIGDIEHVLTRLQNIKTLIGLIVVVIDYKSAISIFVLTDIDDTIGYFGFDGDVLFEQSHGGWFRSGGCVDLDGAADLWAHKLGLG